AAVCGLSFGPASFHLPAHPSLHDHYSFLRYYGCSDFVLGGSSASERHELRGSQADLPDYCVWSSGHSISNHLWSVRRWRGISPGRSADAKGFCPLHPRSGLEKSPATFGDRKSTRLNSSHQIISYAVFFLKKKRTNKTHK